MTAEQRAARAKKASKAAAEARKAKAKKAKRDGTQECRVSQGSGCMTASDSVLLRD